LVFALVAEVVPTALALRLCFDFGMVCATHRGSKRATRPVLRPTRASRTSRWPLRSSGRRRVSSFPATICLGPACREALHPHHVGAPMPDYSAPRVCLGLRHDSRSFEGEHSVDRARTTRMQGEPVEP
jgi:hypothetical protein